MSDEAKVAFIIVAWNNEKLLPECLDSIKKQTYKNHMTIVVDNGSADASIAVAKRSMPEAIILDTAKNNGFAKGNNIGIAEAFKDSEVGYVALINSDARMDKGWLKTVMEFAKLKPNAACLQGTNLNYYDRGIIDSTHIYVTHGAQAAQGHWQEPYKAEIGPKKVFGTNAAICLITRKFIEAQPYAQFFDESLFMYLEDVDVAARATITGWDNYLVPGARAYHMGSASTGGDTGFSNFGLYMTFRNNLGMVIKNYPWRLVLRLMIAMPRSDYRTIRHLLKLNNKTAAKKVALGRLVGIGRAPLYLLKRWKLHGQRNIDSRYLWELMDKGY